MEKENQFAQQITTGRHYDGPLINTLPKNAQRMVNQSLHAMFGVQDPKVGISVDVLPLDKPIKKGVDSDRDFTGGHDRVYQLDENGFRMGAFRFRDDQDPTKKKIVRIFVKGEIEPGLQGELGAIAGLDTPDLALKEISYTIGGRVMRQTVLAYTGPESALIYAPSVNIPDEALRPIQPAYGEASAFPYRLTADEAKILHGEEGQIGGIEGLIRQDVIDRVRADQKAIEQRFGKASNEAEPEQVAEVAVAA